MFLLGLIFFVTRLVRPIREYTQTNFDESFFHSRAMQDGSDIENHIGHLRVVLECIRANKLFSMQ